MRQAVRLIRTAERDAHQETQQERNRGIVVLEDGSLWRIWPGDIALTLNWLPTTNLRVSKIDDEFCSHALMDQAEGSRVRVIEGSKEWPVEQVRRFMKKG